MRGTASFRTATRWRSCSRLLLALGIAGCVTSTTRYYLPTTGEARFSTGELRARAAGMLRLQCPELLGTRDRVAGSAEFRLLTDSAGLVERAYLERSSHGGTFTDILGALVAQLQLDPIATPSRSAADPERHLVVVYSCTRLASALRVQVDPPTQ